MQSLYQISVATSPFSLVTKVSGPYKFYAWALTSTAMQQSLLAVGSA
jgi:hypothetical protein